MPIPSARQQILSDEVFGAARFPAERIRIARTTGYCAWPVPVPLRPKDTHKLFCCEATVARLPYCAAHAAQAYGLNIAARQPEQIRSRVEQYLRRRRAASRPVKARVR